MTKNGLSGDKRVRRKDPRWKALRRGTLVVHSYFMRHYIGKLMSVN